MKLRTQILIIFILTSILIVTVSGYLYYNHVKAILLEQNINELKAVSKAKSARVNSILQNKIVELEILRRSPLIRSDLYKFVVLDSDSVFGNSKISLYNTIIRSKEAIEGINRLLILDSTGTLVISSSPGRTSKTDFSDYKCISSFANKQGVNIEYRYNEHEELVLCLSAYLDSKYILLIENDVNNIISVTEEYTGLGSTGETSIFYIDEDGSIVYLTPLRFYNKAFLKEVKNPSIERFQDEVKKGTVVFTNILDYRNHIVNASVNNVSKTNWKIMTKMDTSETMTYMDDLREMTIWASVSITFIMSLLIYLFSYFFVKPINDLANVAEQISYGDLSKRVEVKSSNEVGQLADSFNKMTNSLVAAQKDLQSKLNELNRSNNALDKFAHVVSHDIKAPLNSIEGLANLLKLELKGKITKEEMELVMKIHDQSRKTKEMIKGILEFAELKSQKGHTEQVDLNEAVDTIKSLLAIPSHIKVLVENRLPIITVEKVLVYQIFQNLISNAVKYIDKSEGLIRIGCTTADNFHRFYISDNGPGIDKEFQSKIFDIFNTGQAMKGYDTTGVGLSIVKGIIEEKGGAIWVESAKGEGATFYFNLPTQ